MSLSLFLELLLRESGVLPKEYFEKIEWLISKLAPYEIPVDLQAKLFRYHEALGHFDVAENVLFELVRRDPAFATEGLQFYGRLRLKNDDELARGNLPRDEIETSVRELEKRVGKR